MLILDNSKNMKKESHVSVPYKGNEIDLSELIKIVWRGKFLIIGFTFLVTLSSFLYMSNKNLSYVATAYVDLPSDNDLLNSRYAKAFHSGPLKELLFTEFLTNLKSYSFQSKVFVDEGYIESFHSETKQIENLDDTVSSYLNSLSIPSPKIANKKFVSYVNEPHKITMTGSKPKAIEKYINSLIEAANNHALDSINSISELAINEKIQDISNNRSLVIARLKEARLNEIETLKSENALRIDNINDSIIRLRIAYRAKLNNEITALKEAAKTAKSLGIIENNFVFRSNQGTSNFEDSDINLIFDYKYNLPIWYLYGERALLERIESLESRSNSDLYISEIIDLNDELLEIQNDNNLEKLIETIDRPFNNSQLYNLKIEENSLNQLLENKLYVMTKAFELVRTPNSNALKSNKRLFVALSLIMSFIVSIIMLILFTHLNNATKQN
tara:strand:+ start:53 stop:1381 length:1329 start_codon:yes stop_codon:yes gene_type:complete